MQETKYSNCIYHSVLFFYSKRCQTKFNTLFDYENQQQWRITKYCDQSFCRYQLKRFCEDLQSMHKKTYFLTIDTTLLASDPLIFRKNLFQSYKNDSSWSD